MIQDDMERFDSVVLTADSGTFICLDNLKEIKVVWLGNMINCDNKWIDDLAFSLGASSS